MRTFLSLPIIALLALSCESEKSPESVKNSEITSNYENSEQTTPGNSDSTSSTETTDSTTPETTIEKQEPEPSGTTSTTASSDETSSMDDSSQTTQNTDQTPSNKTGESTTTETVDSPKDSTQEATKDDNNSSEVSSEQPTGDTITSQDDSKIDTVQVPMEEKLDDSGTAKVDYDIATKTVEKIQTSVEQFPLPEIQQVQTLKAEVVAKIDSLKTKLVAKEGQQEVCMEANSLGDTLNKISLSIPLIQALVPDSNLTVMLNEILEELNALKKALLC